MNSRILVADSADAAEKVKRLLGSEAEVLIARDMKEAEKHLQGPIDLVLCGIHFDGSNMFQLLDTVVSHYAHVPFIVFRDLESALDATFAQSVQVAAKLRGALGLIDLYSLRQQMGPDEADRKFRQLVMRALNSGRL
jgi:DNA-binding NtrC family response regulator